MRKYTPHSKNYTLKSLEAFISKYVNECNGEIHTLEEGCLGLGTVILTNAPNKKSYLIQEYFINSWTSGHILRAYNKLPKKYLSQIQNLEV